MLYQYFGIPHDKELHLIFSFILGILFLIFNKEKSYKDGLIFILLVGITKEVIDSFIPGRNVELLDIITNIFGFFIPFVTYKSIISIYKKYYEQYGNGK